MGGFFDLASTRRDILNSMNELPLSVIVVLAVLTLFLSYTLVLKYAVQNRFVRTRLVMTSFFCFIVVTLTVSFWQYTLATLPFTIPATLGGIVVGYVVGVREAERKLAMQGLNYYMEHFAHVHLDDVAEFNWWSLINFYSVMGGLLLINLVGLSNVIFGGAEKWAILTSVVGAFLLGTIVPYLIHLWSISAKR